MKKFFTLWLLISLQFFSLQAQNYTGNLMFSANLDGLQETPPVITQATGVAGFSLNATHDTLCVNVSVLGLSGIITGAHLHYGAVGVAGPVWVDLTTFISGNSITGTVVAPADSVIEGLMSGLLYINVHTALNPAGEIRGQIFLESDIPFGAILDSAQVVPPVSSSTYGFVSMRLSKSLDKLTIQGLIGNLTDSITGIQLHSGTPGVSGPVVEDLSTGISSNTLTINVDPTAYLNDLLTGNIYINVLTASNPAGEIRGQVILNPKLSFYFRMSGAEETPPNTAPGFGIGNVWFSNTLDSLYYYIVVDTLTTAATGAHLHLGSPGISGAVLVPLTINGNILQGFVTGSGVNLTLVGQMLEGLVYANIHTSTYPGGELRGQLRRYAREGFSYEMNGNNEVPPVTTNATGFGIASLDGEGESLYYSFVVSELGSPAVSAHFHHAAAGASGPILFPIDSLTTVLNGVRSQGYWTSMDTVTPFSATEAALLFSDSVYVNVHTAMFPGGEARGQLMNGGLCYGAVFINELVSANFRVHAYPNPAIEKLNIDVNATAPGNSAISIYDVTGRLLLSQSEYITPGLNHYEIDISTYESGAYLIKLAIGDNELFGKFIKE